MNLSEIQEILEDKFDEPCQGGKNRHIIFWYDDQAEFEAEIDELTITNAKIWKLKDNNNFKTKYQLETKDPESNYLIYSNKPKTNKKNDWLLDTFKYSQSFTADKTTLIMREYGVEDKSLTHSFKKYKKFFNNKNRSNRLKNYNIKDFNPVKLDEAIFSALCKLKSPDIENALRNLLMKSLKESDNDYWEKINKFGDADSVWELIEKKYGFIDKVNNLKDLMFMMLITNMVQNLNIELPDNWKYYISNKDNECVVFISHWMNHSKDSKRYDEIAENLEKEIDIEDYIDEKEISDYIAGETFKIFDKKIIDNLLGSILSKAEDYEWYKEVISIRRTKHWYEYFENIYNAIYWAIEFLQLNNKYENKIKNKESYEFIDKYTNEYYLVDKAYRRFYFSYDKVENKDILNKLREKVENVYSNWFLQELSIKFSNSIDDNKNWVITGLQQQKDFYNNYVKEFVADEERVFIIISDGLRYEMACELKNRLNKKFKASTEIFHMQGSLPSITSLGMASLLPNEKIEIDEEHNIFVDGKKTKTTNDRRNIISSYVDDSVVLKAKRVKNMTRDEMRDEIYGKKLVYIFQNVIDAIGDNFKTVDDVFEAADKAFNEIENMVKALVNNVSATNIFITADHGFIYRRGKLVASDKTDKNVSNNNKESKRYILTKSKNDVEGSITKSLDYISNDTNLNVIVPRGVNAFKTKGAGYNYTHGGASLQEIVIPVIKFKNDRSSSDRNVTNKVNIKLTNISRKITNKITYLNFFQSEKVGQKTIPRNLKLYFEDKEGNKISNENIIIADSKSEKPEERTYREKFTLKNLKYKRDQDYYLIMEDEDESVEKVYKKIEFKISIAIENDFDF